ncbi:hypothetical protein BC831DRAFT_444185 [Entophlyctis helioformis]|nr:hypothetical protein BC831DRAFT_444185 [Entophlyctis helioformis]
MCARHQPPRLDSRRLPTYCQRARRLKERRHYQPRGQSRRRAQIRRPAHVPTPQRHGCSTCPCCPSASETTTAATAACISSRFVSQRDTRSRHCWLNPLRRMEQGLQSDPAAWPDQRYEPTLAATTRALLPIQTETMAVEIRHPLSHHPRSATRLHQQILQAAAIRSKAPVLQRAANPRVCLSDTHSHNGNFPRTDRIRHPSAPRFQPSRLHRHSAAIPWHHRRNRRHPQRPCLQSCHHASWHLPQLAAPLGRLQIPRQPKTPRHLMFSAARSTSPAHRPCQLRTCRAPSCPRVRRHGHN